MATATRTSRGFKVACPKCGQVGGVTIRADDADAFTCSECSEDFTRAEVAAFIARWQRLLAFLDTAPELDD